tara:strand:- start:288 stop:674 length:387 start_codon:yes stop_codon:yes gene_type:complete
MITAVFLILFNVKENVSYFYTPSEISVTNIKLKKLIRIGGFVEKNSFNKESASNFNFRITDDTKSIYVNYNGILPDLFREGQGAVIEGYFESKEIFKATTVFAKHDENYMPNSIKSNLENSGYWNKKY